MFKNFYVSIGFATFGTWNLLEATYHTLTKYRPDTSYCMMLTILAVLQLIAAIIVYTPKKEKDATSYIKDPIKRSPDPSVKSFRVWAMILGVISLFVIQQSFKLV